MVNENGENLELRQYGFSKDKRNDLPQILIGLVVDPNGFPIYYQIFEGNKFEGHTILPVIQDFKDKFKIQELTIVADSGQVPKILDKFYRHRTSSNHPNTTLGFLNSSIK